MYFFFQAEDGIRDGHVTGVQTCALPILTNSHYRSAGSTQPPSGTPPFRSLIWPGTHAERSDPQEAPEPSRSVIGISPVVIGKHLPIPPVTENGPSLLPNIIGRADPGRGLPVQLIELLQFSILRFRQKLYSHLLCHVGNAATGFMLLPGVQSLSVVTEASPPLRAFRGEIVKENLTRFLVVAPDIRFPSRSLHLI